MRNAVEHDEERRRFRLDLGDGKEAYLAYAPVGGVYDFHYTYVPPALRGQGIAARVVAHAAEHARAHGWRVRAGCGYVRAWLDRNPDVRDAIAVADD